MKITTKKGIFTFFLVSLICLQSAVAKVTVFAAASMSNVLQQIAEQYKQENPKAEIVFSFASSSTLAKQIEYGAEADIFVSADLKWTAYLAEKKQIEEKTQTRLAGNQLVMIAPKDSQIEKIELANHQWHKWLDNSYLALGDPNHVPAGVYAKTAFVSLGQWDAIQTKVAAANNVRGALLLVERQEAPLGVVYSTDAKASPKVKVVATFPENLHSPVEYPMVIVREHRREEVQQFFDYLGSEKAKKQLVDYGFSVK